MKLNAALLEVPVVEVMEQETEREGERLRETEGVNKGGLKERFSNNV